MRRLASDSERPRYEALGGAICRAGTPRSLLDLGCAHGLLAEHLGTDALSLYTGIDISPAAVVTARRSYEHLGARFFAADLRHWTPPAPVDTVVFNEVLYYFSEPAALIRRYMRWLSPGGCLFVSMYHASLLRAPLPRLRIDRIWQRLGREFDLRDPVEVRDENGAPAFRIAQVVDPSPRRDAHPGYAERDHEHMSPVQGGPSSG